MKHILFLIAILFSFASNAEKAEKIEIKDPVFNYIDKHSKQKRSIKKTIARHIYKNHQKYLYNTPFTPMDFVRQMKKESSFELKAKSPGYGAMGLMQICPKSHTNLLYIVDNGKLGRHIKNRGITNTYKYFYNLKYNIEMGAIIMRDLLKVTKNNASQALIMYSHRRNTNYYYSLMASTIKRFRHPYVRAILFDMWGGQKNAVKIPSPQA